MAEATDAGEMLWEPAWFKPLRLMVQQLTVTLINVGLKASSRGHRATKEFPAHLTCQLLCLPRRERRETDYMDRQRPTLLERQNHGPQSAAASPGPSLWESDLQEVSCCPVTIQEAEQ